MLLGGSHRWLGSIDLFDSYRYLTWIVWCCGLMVMLLLGILIGFVCLVGRCSLLVVCVYYVLCCSMVVVVWCIRSGGILWLLLLGIVGRYSHYTHYSTTHDRIVSIVLFDYFSRKYYPITHFHKYVNIPQYYGLLIVHSIWHFGHKWSWSMGCCFVPGKICLKYS